MPEITHICPACAAGLLGECENAELLSEANGVTWIIPCAVKFIGPAAAIPTGKNPVGRPMAGPGEITDAKSTGRKRAAMLAPILTGQRCGWAFLKHAGGGVVPILGCNGNLLIEQKGGDDEKGLTQGDRHHGPDKNTLNNSVGVNLHSICVDCHHRWHALNDRFYDEDGRPGAEFPFLPVEPYYTHDSQTTFTDEEFTVAEEWWDAPTFDRGEYPFKPEVLPLSPVLATLEPEDNPFADEIGDLSL